MAEGDILQKQSKNSKTDLPPYSMNVGLDCWGKVKIDNVGNVLEVNTSGYSIFLVLISLKTKRIIMCQCVIKVFHGIENVLAVGRHISRPWYYTTCYD